MYKALDKEFGTSPGKQGLLLVTYIQERSTQKRKEGRDLFKLKELVGKRTNWDESDH